MQRYKTRQTLADTLMRFMGIGGQGNGEKNYSGAAMAMG